MNPVRTIVIPAYKEAPLIVSSLQQLRDYLQSVLWLDSTEVIVVTADAPDSTQALVAEHIQMFPLHRHIQPGPRAGKGRDVKVGLSAATSSAVLFMDADLATPLKHISEMFVVLEQRGGMVIGVRDLSHMHKTFSRKVSSQLSNKIVKSVVGNDIHDSQCGFKAFDRTALDVILPRSVVQGWGFDFEFIKIAKLHHIPVTSVPITDWHDPKPEGTGLAGDSQLQAMKQTFRELMQVKKNQRKGLYK